MSLVVLHSTCVPEACEMKSWSGHYFLVTYICSYTCSGLEMASFEAQLRLLTLTYGTALPFLYAGFTDGADERTCVARSMPAKDSCLFGILFCEIQRILSATAARK